MPAEGWAGQAAAGLDSGILLGPCGGGGAGLGAAGRAASESVGLALPPRLRWPGAQALPTGASGAQPASRSLGSALQPGPAALGVRESRSCRAPSAEDTFSTLFWKRSSP